MVRPLEHHGDGCQGRDQDHDPLQISDESQELVHRLEPDLPLLPGHRVFQAAVVMSADDGLANSPVKLFEKIHLAIYSIIFDFFHIRNL